MCGIAGILGVTDPVQAEKDVRAMIERIAHRGPNGIRVESGPGWCVAHARLSIIDLEGGWQPLHGAGSTVIGNGEIYNYLELAEEFQLKDKLATGSDFEPLLHIYAQEGEKAFERLRGMYAFCFIGCDGRTWLVRDGFGIKPLYVRQERDHVEFSSEIRSLRPGRLKAEATQQLLALNYSLHDVRSHVRRLEASQGETLFHPWLAVGVVNAGIGINSAQPCPTHATRNRVHPGGVIGGEQDLGTGDGHGRIL